MRTSSPRRRQPRRPSTPPPPPIGLTPNPARAGSGRRLGSIAMGDKPHEGPLRLPQPPGRPAGWRRAVRARVLRGARRHPSEIEPFFLARAPVPDHRAFAAPRAHRDRLGQRRPEPVLHPHRPRRTGTGSSSGSHDKEALTESYRDLLLGDPAGHRALPAHALHRLRRDPGHENRLAGCADPLHAARLHTDLPPERADGADDPQPALPRGVAAPLPRVLSAAQPAALLHARALHQVAAVAGGPLHRAEPLPAGSATSSGASRPTRSCSRTTAGCRSSRSPEDADARDQAAQPLRLLRAVHAVQGRRPAARGDGDPGRRLRRPSVDARREPRGAVAGVPGALPAPARGDRGDGHRRRLLRPRAARRS